jgi:VanZ family protein
VYGYLAVLFFATPYLPMLITWAQGIWRGEWVSGFVLGTEIALGAGLILGAGFLRVKRRREFRVFLLAAGGFLGFGVLFYRMVPNPYELTHMPEYALLSVLLVHARKPSSYLYPAAITIMIGAVDELYQGFLPLRYFAWYDIGLNGLGGILGLTLFWGLRGSGGNQKSKFRTEDKNI